MFPVPKEYRPFLNSLKKKCKYHKVKLILSPSKQVTLTDDYQHECSGYFNEDQKIIVVACGKPIDHWIDVLVHESCHMDQWLGKDPRSKVWDQSYINLWNYISGTGRTLKRKEINEAIEGVMDCELDCEKRSVEKIIKWQLPVDVDKYIRMANAYVASFRFIRQYRTFPEQIGKDDYLIKSSPADFIEIHDPLPEEMERNLHRFYRELVDRKKNA